MVRKILAHLCIILGGMCFVLFVVDCIKAGAMSFLNNGITKWLVCFLSLLAIVNAILSLAAQTREAKLVSNLRRSRGENREIERPAARRSAYSASSARAGYPERTRTAQPQGSRTARTGYPERPTASRSAYSGSTRTARSSSGYGARSPYSGRR